MKILWIIFLTLIGCRSHIPSDFQYIPIKTSVHTLASWQKIKSPSKPLYVYIEGDGYAFNHKGMSSQNPTPRDNYFRSLAFSDTHHNVVYLGRPCQYIMSDICRKTDWTDGRFSEKNVASMGQAIEKIAQNRKVILIGYSGGALMSGLVIEKFPQIKVQQWITVAGLINHTDWTNYWNDTPLSQSLDLEKIPAVPQKHYIGQKDRVIPPSLTLKRVDPRDAVIVPNATHNSGFSLKWDED